MAVGESSAPRTYGNWRKPMSAGLGALGTIGTAALLLGLIVVILTMMFFGILAALVLALLWGLGLLLLVVRNRHGKTLLQRVATRTAWARARAGGAHLYRSGPLGQARWGTFQLPGLAAASTLTEGRDSYDRPFALVRVPATGHFTVVFAADPDGASLVDEEQIDLWVAHWGQWLAALGDEPGVVVALLAVEDLAGQRVAPLLEVADPLDVAPVVLVVEAGKDVQALEDPPVHLKRLAERGRVSVTLQHAGHVVGAHRAGVDRGDDPEHVGPVAADPLEVDRAARGGVQLPVVGGAVNAPRALVGHVREGGAVLRAEQVAEAEHEIGVGAGVGDDDVPSSRRARRRDKEGATRVIPSVRGVC